MHPVALWHGVWASVSAWPFWDLSLPVFAAIPTFVIAWLGLKDIGRGGKAVFFICSLTSLVFIVLTASRSKAVQNSYSETVSQFMGNREFVNKTAQKPMSNTELKDSMSHLADDISTFRMSRRGNDDFKPQEWQEYNDQTARLFAKDASFLSRYKVIKRELSLRSIDVTALKYNCDEAFSSKKGDIANCYTELNQLSKQIQ